MSTFAGYQVMAGAIYRPPIGWRQLFLRFDLRKKCSFGGGSKLPWCLRPSFVYADTWQV